MSEPFNIFVETQPVASTPFSGSELLTVVQAGVSKQTTLSNIVIDAIATGTIFYVSNSGNDASTGTSASNAWKTIAKVNSSIFAPGDSVLFQGGQSFSGAIVWPSGGTASAPITVGSYGNGRATINSGALGGFYSESQSGIIVRDLIFIGNGATGVNGVWFNNTLAGNVHCKNVQAINLDVSGYGWSGVIADGNNGSAGYDDVVIRGCVTHGNCTVVQGLTTRGTTGIGVFSNTGYGLANNAPSHNNVIIENCVSHDNIGILDTQWTGSGIVIAETNQGIIRGCTAYNNQCPIGIWSYDSTNIEISYCVSHHNTSPTLGDGGGFDLDLGTSDCTISNCYSHDNFGEGFLLESGTFPGTATTNNLSCINCVSVDDGVGSGSEDSCAFELVADNPTTTNITFSGCRSFNSNPNAKSFLMWGGHIAAVTGIVFDCEFICDGTSGQLFISTVNPLTSVPTTPNSSNFFFRGNRYIGAVPISWGGTSYATVNAWAVARNQEDQQQAPQITAGAPFFVRGSNPSITIQDTETHGDSWDLFASVNGTVPYAGLFEIATNKTQWTSNVDGAGSFNIRRGAAFTWSSDSSFADIVGDTGISRNGAGIIAFGNGTPGDISATLQCTLISLAGNTAFTSTFNAIKSTYRYNNSIDLGGGFGSGTSPNITFSLNGGPGGGGTMTTIASYNVFNTGDIGFLFQPPSSGGTVFEDTNNGLYFSTVLGGGGGGSPVYFAPGRTIRAKITPTGSFVLQVNGALATNATDGFTYIPTCAGPPTGTPTTQTGAVALVYDTSNNQLWVYNGSWLQPKTPAAAAIVHWQ